MDSWKERFQGLSRSVGGTLKSLTSSGSGHVSRVVDALKGTYETAATGVERVAEYGDDLYDRWLGEDEAEILDKCPIPAGILARRALFDTDSETFGRLFNVRVRPVITAAVLSGTGTGMVAFDEALSRITRHVFDGDQLIGALGADLMASRLGPEKVAEINRFFMDTVPGASHPGGGWVHRVQHGHDLDAIAQVFQEYGSEGGIQALYHVYGRDFFTPAGTPILPAGSNEVHGFLTEQLGLKAKDAADLISLNFVEVLGGMLTGVFAVVTLIRLASLVKGVRENNTVRDLVSRAMAACDNGDFVTASALLQDALSYRPRDGLLTFLLGAMYHRAGNRLQAHLAFRDVTAWAARDEPMIEVGGVKISLRGVAAAGALATSEALAHADDYKSSWLEHVIALSRAGITAYESTAHKLLDRRFIKRFGKSSVLPPRYLSAALNFYLAGRLSGASMYISERESVLARTVRKSDEALAGAAGRSSLRSRLDDLDFMRPYIRAELGPLPEPTPSA